MRLHVKVLLDVKPSFPGQRHSQMKAVDLSHVVSLPNVNINRSLDLKHTFLTLVYAV